MDNLESHYRPRPRSEDLFERAQRVIPGGVNSPVRSFKAVVGKPLYLKKGEGPYVTDQDNNKLIDFCGSWGPLIHGHAHPVIIKAIQDTAQLGTSFGTPHELEVEIAEFITERIPWVEKIRFVSSGTEAVMSAIRLARGYTQRPLILKFEGCYHGHVDSLLVQAGSGLLTFGQSGSAGIPGGMVAETLVCHLDDQEGVKKAFADYGHRIAAAIIEPIPANAGLLVQKSGLLKLLRDLTLKHGSLLIFDEVISGFRVGFQGAAGLYGIQPDLVTYGKIIGGGLPVGAFGGSHQIMGCLAPLGPVYQAGTLSGNPVSLAAGLAALRMCAHADFYQELRCRMRDHFLRPLGREIAKRRWPLRIPSVGSIFWFLMQGKIPRTSTQVAELGTRYYREFHRKALDGGVYLSPSHFEVGFVSAAHSPGVLETAADRLIKELFHFYRQQGL